jgi:hypothetical protein
MFKKELGVMNQKTTKQKIPTQTSEKISISEFRRNWKKVCERIQNGEIFIVTRYNKSIGYLKPI